MTAIKRYALITGGIVQNIIISNAEFAATIDPKNHYDFIIDVSNRIESGISPGWAYNSDTDSFSCIDDQGTLSDMQKSLAILASNILSLKTEIGLLMTSQQDQTVSSVTAQISSVLNAFNSSKQNL